MNTALKKRRKQEELFNSWSHGLGILIAIACTAIVVTRAALYGDAWHIVSYSIFGAGMIVLYTASTVFHGAKNLRLKSHLNVFDHVSIYILIAATYTPFTLVAIRGPFGWVLFGLVWAMAIAGSVFKIWFYTVRLRRLSTWLYAGMGWSFLIAIVPIVKNLPGISLLFLLAGCISYFAGIFFYLRRDIPFGHGVFHIFILCGSICHFFSMVYMI